MQFAENLYLEILGLCSSLKQLEVWSRYLHADIILIILFCSTNIFSNLYGYCTLVLYCTGFKCGLLWTCAIDIHPFNRDIICHVKALSCSLKIS